MAAAAAAAAASSSSSSPLGNPFAPGGIFTMAGGGAGGPSSLVDSGVIKVCKCCQTSNYKIVVIFHLYLSDIKLLVRETLKN